MRPCEVDTGEPCKQCNKPTANHAKWHARHVITRAQGGQSKHDPSTDNGDRVSDRTGFDTVGAQVGARFGGVSKDCPIGNGLGNPTSLFGDNFDKDITDTDRRLRPRRRGGDKADKVN
jgi:hypothetical protein